MVADAGQIQKLQEESPNPSAAVDTTRPTQMAIVLAQIDKE